MLRGLEGQGPSKNNELRTCLVINFSVDYEESLRRKTWFSARSGGFASGPPAAGRPQKPPHCEYEMAFRVAFLKYCC